MITFKFPKKLQVARYRSLETHQKRRLIAKRYTLNLEFEFIN